MLEAIVKASPLAIIALDHQINLILWNPAAERLFGWDPQEVLGKPYPLAPGVLMDEVLENIRRLEEGETCWAVETCRQHKDQSLIDVSLSTAPMCDSSGLTIGYMAIFADIREHKRTQAILRESEANYRTIFDAANDATFVFDPENCTILDVNLKMCEMYGYQREQVRHLNVQDLSAETEPYTREHLMEKIRKTHYNASHLFEWLAKDRQGRLFWIEVNMKGAVIGGEYRVLAVARDISARKEAEEENKRMQERLRQIDKMAAVGTLASGIAHEINNPNNFILANGQALSDLWPDLEMILKHYAEEHGEFYLGRLPFSEARPLVHKMLRGLVEGSHRINTIVTGLKSFARQEKTNLAQQVDLNKVIQAALTMLHNQIRCHTDKFSCELAPVLPLVTGSFQQLEQVIINLIINALQALPNRQAAITVRTFQDMEQGHLCMEVQDQGQGIPEPIQQVIFNPFFTTRLESGGTGLGLSICYGIIKEHGGQIECTSTPQTGTSFVVRLPTKHIKTEKGSK